jgi:hypothetical protein
MAIARVKLVDVSLARSYRCISRCVRKAFVLGQGDADRSTWKGHRTRWPYFAPMRVLSANGEVPDRVRHAAGLTYAHSPRARLAVRITPLF